jgi:hypothetical protein
MPNAAILCLANSKKLSGRCVAGLRIDGGGWLRPVSKLPNGVLNVGHYFLDKGKDATLLDVIQVGLKRPKPDMHQPENWLMDDTVWKLLGTPKLDDCAAILRKAIVPGSELFRGYTDRVEYADFQKTRADASLALVAPARIDMFVRKKTDGKHQVRGRFTLGGGAKTCNYDLSITEPYWEKAVTETGPRSLTQADSKFIVTVSLGEPYNGMCYKLIAAVIPLPPALASVV